MEIILLITVIGGMAYIAIQNHKLKTQVPLGVNQIQKPLEVSVEILINEYQSTQEQMKELISTVDGLQKEYVRVEAGYGVLKNSITNSVNEAQNNVVEVKKQINIVNRVSDQVEKQMSSLSNKFDSVDKILKVHENKIETTQTQLHRAINSTREERHY